MERKFSMMRARSYPVDERVGFRKEGQERKRSFGFSL